MRISSRALSWLVPNYASAQAPRASSRSHVRLAGAAGVGMNRLSDPSGRHCKTLGIRGARVSQHLCKRGTRDHAPVRVRVGAGIDALLPGTAVCLLACWREVLRVADANPGSRSLTDTNPVQLGRTAGRGETKGAVPWRTTRRPRRSSAASRSSTCPPARRRWRGRPGSPSSAGVPRRSARSCPIRMSDRRPT